MKNIDKAKLLAKIQKIFKDNNLNITSCGCCGGYHIECNNEDICCGENFVEDAETSIKYYKDNVNKISVNIIHERFPEIQMIKIDNKIVNLGGRSYPFNKFMKHLNNNQLIEFFKDFI